MALKFKRHESFRIRDGWVEKALNTINENEGISIFSKNEGVAYLGVGSNMVKSIKYWLTAMKLIQDRNNTLTDRAKMLLKYDPYLDLRFSWWFLHYCLVENNEDAPVFNSAFNDFPEKTISKSMMVDRMAEKFGKDEDINVDSLAADVNVLFQSYTTDKADKNTNPEDNMACPLAALKLVRKDSTDTYTKMIPSYASLDYRLVYYSLTCAFELDSFSIEDAMVQKNGPGKVFNLDKTLLLSYLNDMKNAELVDINRTAGLNMIYFRKRVSIEDLFKDYLEKKDE